MLVTSADVAWAVVTIHPHSMHTLIIPSPVLPFSHPPPTPPPLSGAGRGIQGTECEQGCKLPVAAKGTGAFCVVPGPWEGGVGEEEAPLLSSHPSAVLPALRKAGTVCYTGAGMYRVFQMASVQSYTGCFLFIPLLQQWHPAVRHRLSSAHLPLNPQDSQS